MSRHLSSLPVTLVARGLLAGALLLAMGCSPTRTLATGEHQPSEAERLVARADELGRAGDRWTARYVYQQVVREWPGDAAAPTALYGLGRLELDPAPGLRDYRAAHAAFSRLLTEYPQSRWAADACLWQATLADLLAREDEATRMKLRLRRRERKPPGSSCSSSSCGVST